MSAQPLAALHEPSLADAIAHIERSETLTIEQRSHWRCSMRFLARAIDRPPSLIPARWVAVRLRLDRIHHSQLDVTAKTFANHRANLRVALNLFCGERNIPRRGHRLSEPWSGLWASVDDLRTREQLSRFLRYLSANGILPEGVDDTVVQAFVHYWEKTGLQAPNAQSHRQVVRAWNKCSETIPRWPRRKLYQVPVRSLARGPAWEAFPLACATRLMLFWLQSRPGSFRFRLRESGRPRPTVQCALSFKPSRAWR
jgi:hypothetical protein